MARRRWIPTRNCQRDNREAMWLIAIVLEITRVCGPTFLRGGQLELIFWDFSDYIGVYDFFSKKGSGKCAPVLKLTRFCYLQYVQEQAGNSGVHAIMDSRSWVLDGDITFDVVLWPPNFSSFGCVFSVVRILLTKYWNRDISEYFWHFGPFPPQHKVDQILKKNEVSILYLM